MKTENQWMLEKRYRQTLEGYNIISYKPVTAFDEIMALKNYKKFINSSAYDYFRSIEEKNSIKNKTLVKSIVKILK